MSQTIPKLKEIQAAVKTKLQAESFFVTASADVSKDPATGEQSVVIMDTGTQEKLKEKRLREKGLCVVVEPLVIAKLRDQSGPAWVMDCEIMVKVMVNSERNENEAEPGADVDIYETVVKVIETLTHCRSQSAATRVLGGEFFKLGPDAMALSQFDQGLWVYDLMFTKEALL